LRIPHWLPWKNLGSFMWVSTVVICDFCQSYRHLVQVCSLMNSTDYISYLQSLFINSYKLYMCNAQGSLICTSSEPHSQAQNATLQISAGTFHPNLYKTIYYILFFCRHIFLRSVLADTKCF